MDKFTTNNTIRAYEFFGALRTLNPNRIVFGDGKHLKGEEFWSKKVRRDPITGEVPSIKTDANFRNTYTIIGLCTMNEDSQVPVLYRIRKETNDADAFFGAIEFAVDCGYLRENDVLVLDNAAIQWLWQEHKILVLFLPSRTPEWNPIELVWRLLLNELQKYPIHVAVQEFAPITQLQGSPQKFLTMSPLKILESSSKFASMAFLVHYLNKCKYLCTYNKTMNNFFALIWRHNQVIPRRHS